MIHKHVRFNLIVSLNGNIIILADLQSNKYGLKSYDET